MMHTRTTARRAAVALLAAGGLAAGLSGCGGSAGPEQGTTLEDLQAEGPAVDDADEEAIAAAPNDDTELFLPDKASYLGREVTVSGRIVQVFSPQVFVIGEGDLATLVTRADTALQLQPGTTAQVSGTVGRFVLVDVEEELGADLVDEDFRDFERAPYIHARDVNLLDADG